MLFPLLTLQGEHQQNGITMDNSSSSSTRTRDDESQDRDNKPAQYEESLEPDSTSIWGSRASLVDGWHKSPTSIHESKSSAPSSSSNCRDASVDALPPTTAPRKGRPFEDEFGSSAFPPFERSNDSTSLEPPSAEHGVRNSQEVPVECMSWIILTLGILCSM
eukprot:gb/GECG01000298.1/.p1 GENE.gb/GECG01000298.1/~~gb/GECG01000298.1/.p1  ORF type:complete len:162 (+),score=16.77 gb/GECG01000298.1/:1-486(+)